MSHHPFQCRCASLQGHVQQPRKALRVTCYCADCQAYARLTDGGRGVLDALGGTEAVATQTRHVRVTAGCDQLACNSLSERGLLRWYARCCGTPIANTLRHPKAPYVALLHPCLGTPQAVEQAFGPLRVRMYTKRALGPVDAMTGSTLRALAGFVPTLLLARINGSYRESSFFGPDRMPVAVPRVVAPRHAP